MTKETLKQFKNYPSTLEDVKRAIIVCEIIYFPVIRKQEDIGRMRTHGDVTGTQRRKPAAGTSAVVPGHPSLAVLFPFK